MKNPSHHDPTESIVRLAAAENEDEADASILSWLRGEPLPGAPDELVWPILTQAQLDGLPVVAPRRRAVARALRLTRLVSGGRP